MYLDALHTDKFSCDLATKAWGGTVATPKIVTQKQVIIRIGMFFPKIAASIKGWYQSWINSPHNIIPILSCLLQNQMKQHNWTHFYHSSYNEILLMPLIRAGPRPKASQPKN